jgi:hypothetical protein
MENYLNSSIYPGSLTKHTCEMYRMPRLPSKILVHLNVSCDQTSRYLSNFTCQATATAHHMFPNTYTTTTLFTHKLRDFPSVL